MEIKVSNLNMTKNVITINILVNGIIFPFIKEGDQDLTIDIDFLIEKNKDHFQNESLLSTHLLSEAIEKANEVLTQSEQLQKIYFTN